MRMYKEPIKKHAHKPSQLPSYPSGSRKPPVLNENFAPTFHEVEFDPDINDTNEANISFQMTAPKISFNSPQSFQVKRSYLDRVEVPPLLCERDPNVCEELAASPTSQFGPCSRRCTLVANENVDFYYKHTARNSEEYTPVVTEDIEVESKPIHTIVHNINLKKPSENMEQLKVENAELKQKNADMRNELQKIEAKYQRIAQLLDQVKEKVEPAAILEDRPNTLIDSVDSQATFVDENDISNKNIFANGIIQMLVKAEVPKKKKAASTVPDKSHIQIAKLKQVIERQKRTIKEYKEFVFTIMENLQQAAEDSENQSRMVSVRSFFQ